MISLDDIIARLRNELVPGTLKSVEGAAELAAAVDLLKSSPTAFVMPAADAAAADTASTMEVRQRVTQRFAVLLSFKAIGATGAAQLNAIDKVRGDVMRALIGWLPDGSIEPLSYAGGRVAFMDLDAGVIVWGAEFNAVYYVRSETT